MRNTIYAVMFAAIALTVSGCDVTPGTSCSAEGSKHTNKNGYSYTCKSTPEGKRIWQQDAPLTPDHP